MSHCRILTAAFLTLSVLIPGCKNEEPPEVKDAPRISAPAPVAPASPHSSPPAAPSAQPHAETKPPAPETPPDSRDSTSVTAAGLTLTASPDWTREEPSSSGMNRVAQFKIKGDNGDAELVVYYFGAGQGGPVQANIDRWKGQLRNPDKEDAPADATTSTFERDGLQISTVTARGTYSGMMGMRGGTQTSQPDYLLYGAIISGGPEGSVFIKATGPQKTLEPHLTALDAFAKSAHPAKS